MKGVIASYLKRKRKIVGAYLMMLSVFWIIFYFYNIQTEAVNYACLLILVIMLIVGVIDFTRYYRRYDMLLGIKQAIHVDLPEFPEARDKAEELYQEMVAQLFAQKRELDSQWSIERQDMLDYYSLWAHQIKTPIAAMGLVLQADSQMEQECRAALKMELFKTEQYVEMVLTYIRMGDMGKDMVLNHYSLDEIIKQAVRKYSQMFILKKIKLELEVTGMMVLTDEKWLVFVLEQILSNALKYTKEGFIRIYMDKQEADTLVIEDSGIGIWEEDLPRVFEKGFTGYNGRTDKKSTGIGLYLSKQVMERLRHRVWICSKPEQGTNVYLYLGRDERTAQMLD